MSSMQELMEGRIDFAGQHLVEEISRYVLITATVSAFFLGFIFQSLSITFSVVGAATVLTALLIIPPWPMFNRHPVKWLPVIQPSEAKKVR